MKGKYTEVTNCTVLQLAALDMNIKSTRQHMLVLGHLPWTKRDRAFLDRLRDVRGLGIVEERREVGVYITIYGTLLRGGFTKIITDCQKLESTRVRGA